MSTDEEILMDFIKSRKEKLQEEEEKVAIIFDSMNKDNIDDIINKVKILNKKAVFKGAANISRLRPTQSEVFATLVHKILQLPDPIENGKPTWRDCFEKYMDQFPVPVIRLMYENGEFTLDKILSKIYDYQSVAFADIIPDFYSFAKDFPQARLSREWIISGCVPGTINALIKVDDIDSVKKITDDRFKKNIKLPIPEFEYRFYGYHFYIDECVRTPLNVAAFYGAVKCFKYFLLLGNKVTNHTAQMAVAGGNLEIFRICEQHKADLTGCEKIAADFCRFDFMKWFKEVNGKSAYSSESVSSILNVTSSQLDIDNTFNQIMPADLLMKLIEEGKSLEKHEFANLFNKVNPEIQIPIARAMLAHGFQPINLFSLGGCDEFFKFAMEHYDLKDALKENKFMVTHQITRLGDELFNKLGEDGIWDYLDLYFFANSNTSSDRLYRLIEKNPSRVSVIEWQQIIKENRTECFKFIPQDVEILVEVMPVLYSQIQETISMYKSLPPNIIISIQHCFHPSVFFELSERIDSFDIFSAPFFNLFAIKQLGEECKKNSLMHVKKCDTWGIIKQIL